MLVRELDDFLPQPPWTRGAGALCPPLPASEGEELDQALPDSHQLQGASGEVLVATRYHQPWVGGTLPPVSSWEETKMHLNEENGAVMARGVVLNWLEVLQLLVEFEGQYLAPHQLH